MKIAITYQTLPQYGTFRTHTEVNEYVQDREGQVNYIIALRRDGFWTNDGNNTYVPPSRIVEVRFASA